ETPLSNLDRVAAAHVRQQMPVAAAAPGGKQAEFPVPDSFGDRILRPDEPGDPLGGVPPHPGKHPLRLPPAQPVSFGHGPDRLACITAPPPDAAEPRSTRRRPRERRLDHGPAARSRSRASTCPALVRGTRAVYHSLIISQPHAASTRRK